MDKTLTASKICITVFIILMLSIMVYAGGSVNSDFSISDYLIVGSSSRGLSGLVTTAGDALIGNIMIAEQSIRVFAQKYGIGLNVLTYNTVPIISGGGTTSITASNQLLCDTTNPFSATDVTDYITIGNAPYIGATGEITDYVNSTCVRLGFGSVGDDNLQDATGLNYFKYTHPIASFLDNGMISFNVGTNPDAKFEIHIANGTGAHSALIEDVAGSENHVAFTVENDFKGHSGTTGVKIHSKSTEIADGIHRDALKIIGDASLVSNSAMHFIQLDAVGLGSGNDVDALHITPLVTHIIHMGSADTLDSGYVEDINATGNFTSTTENIEMFEQDNDYIYIGNSLNFTTIGIDLFTTANVDLNLEYYYCNASGWFLLTDVSDSTAGMQSSGTISFINPSDRGICNTEYDGTPFSDTADYTYIALKRTKNNVLTTPVERYISISGGSTYFILQKDMLKLNPVDTAPETCDATHLGAIYFDTSEDQMCVCTSGGWKEGDDTSASCT